MLALMMVTVQYISQSACSEQNGNYFKAKTFTVITTGAPWVITPRGRVYRGRYSSEGISILPAV